MAFIGQTTIQTSAPDFVLQNVPADPSVSLGDWVRMQNGIAVRALADDMIDSNVIGLVELKGGGTVNIRVLGVSAPLFANLDESKEYFLSDVDPGKMSLSIPYASGHVVLKLGQPYSSTQFLVLKGIRMVRA